MEWPFRRFVRFFDAFQRRELCEEWKRRKALMVSATVANTNLDDERNDRNEIISKIEQSHERVIAMIWNGGEDDEDQVDEEAWNDPFMRAGRAAVATLQAPVLPGEREIGSLP